MTQSQPAAQQQQIAVPLSLELVNAVLGYLDTRPHAEVRRLIDAIHAQHQQYMQQQQEQAEANGQMVAGTSMTSDTRQLPSGKPVVQ